MSSPLWQARDAVRFATASAYLGQAGRTSFHLVPHRASPKIPARSGIFCGRTSTRPRKRIAPQRGRQAEIRSHEVARPKIIKLQWLTDATLESGYPAPFQRIVSITNMKRRIRSALVFHVAALLSLQELIWNGGLRLTHRMTTWPSVVALTKRARQMPASEALCALLLPILAVLPLQAAALVLTFNGQWLAGLFGFIAANILGVGLLARIYVIVEPVLLSVPVLAQARQDFLEWRENTRTSIQKDAVQAG